MKKFGLMLALLVAVILAAPAFAQEQTGGITGTVKDDSGAILPGVTVEAIGPSGTVVTTSDERGEFRFPRLSPGVYKVSAKVEGFQPAEISGIVVSLGQAPGVNFSLKVGSFEETIVVSGEGAQIDTRSSATATSIAAEQIELIPKGRDFTSVVTQAAGASNEAFLGGVSIDGASGSENRFVIDGIDTTHPQDGLSGQNFITDFLEEIQVKSAGYAAEYGGSVGGVVNAVTKSGTNDFQGWVGAYYSDSSFNGDSRPTYRESEPPTYHRTFDKDDATTTEPGFALGGPVFRDHAWFYAGYNPSFTSTSRTPLNSSNTFDQDVTRQYFAANIKGNVGSKFLYKVSANLSPAETENSLPALDGSTPSNADLTVTTKNPAASYSAYGDFLPTSSFYASARVGYYDIDTETEGVDSIANIRFRNGVIPVPTSDPRYRPTGFASTPAASFTGTDTDSWKRQAASLDGNLFANAAGSHAFKAGVQYEKIKNEVSTGENGNDYEIRWGLSDRYGLGVIGTYGSVAVRRFRTEGAAESTNVGLYLQDAWQVRPNLTINVGVRTEQERVPNYGAARDSSLPEYAISFDFQDKLAPRLGFSWDVLSDQKLKVYGSFGTYYDITKLEMPRGSFGADQWVTHVYALNTLDWQSLPGLCSIAENNLSNNPCPGLGPQRVRDLRLPTNPADNIDPDLKPMEQQEWQLGSEYQLNETSMVGFRYVNKTLKNTIEDIGFLAEDGSGEIYITGNPGRGIVAGDPDGAGPIPEQPKAIRDYQAAEFSFNRRFKDNWSLRASYTYSKLEGNYSGLASSDEFGRTDPNVARYFDGLVYGFDQNGKLVEGVLNTDRPHAVEAQLLYRLPWNTNIGVNTSWRSGTPVTSQGNFNGVQFFPYGRNDLGRLDSLTQTDLLISQPFQIGRFSLELSLNVLNLFDEDAVTRIGNNKWQDDLCDFVADCSPEAYFTDVVPYDYDTVMTQNGGTLDPAYKQALAYQAPRTVRLGLKFNF
jgi:hypothetical protein